VQLFTRLTGVKRLALANIRTETEVVIYRSLISNHPPMTRAYAVSLIFVALLIASGAFWWQHVTLTSRTDADIKLAVDVNERVVEVLERSIRERTHKMSTLLEDESKERFGPIQQVSVEADNAKAVFDKAYKVNNQIATNPRHQVADLQDLHVITRRGVRKVFSKYSAILREYGEQMDLRREEAETKIERIYARLEPVLTSFDRIAASDDSNVAYKLSLIQVGFLTALDEVLEDIASMAGGKVISCHFGPEFYPIIATNFVNPKHGDTLSTRLWAGSYATELRPEDITIIVNGDSLHSGLNGYIDYSYVAQGRGEKSLKMELIVRNRLTGELTRQGVTEYGYFVR